MPPATRDDEHEAEQPDGVLGAVAGVVEAVDAMVPVEQGAAAGVEVAASRYLPWVGVLFGVCAVLLVPWIVYIALTLPARALSPNYHVAWTGFDVLLLLALAATAVTVLRRSRFMAMSAGWAAGMLVTDAWFDTVTSPAGWDLVEAAVMGALVELPLAAVCVWVALHASDLAERRVRVLLRRQRRQERRRRRRG